MVSYVNSFSTTKTIFLLALFFGVQTGANSAEQCPHVINDEIQQCVQPVAEYAKVLNQQDTSSKSTQNSGYSPAIQIGLPKIGGQVFKELCRLIRDFETCVEGFRDKCQKHITINLISSSYGFLCNEGYDTFMISADCLMELDQRPTVKKCHDDTLQKIEKANNEISISMLVKLERMCNALNSFSGCVMVPISENCGVEAWKVIFRVLKDTTKTLMPACHFPEQPFPESVSPKKELVIQSSEWLLPKPNKAKTESISKTGEGSFSRKDTEKGRQHPKNSHKTPDYLVENQQFEDRPKFTQNQISQGTNNQRRHKGPNSSSRPFLSSLSNIILAILFNILMFL